MTTPCEKCPNANDTSIHHKMSGDAVILIDREGGLEYGFVPSDGRRLAMGQLELNRIGAEALADDIENCSGPTAEGVPAIGMLGWLGLKKIVTYCPALAKYMNPVDPASVEAYINQAINTPPR